MIVQARKLYALATGVVGAALNRSHGSFIASAAAVQLLPLFSAPIVARLYSPTAFGAYAVFYALVTVIGSTASLALHNVILIENSDSSAAHAAMLSLVIAAAVSLVTALAIFGVPSAWLNWAVGAESLHILPWLPATVLVSSSYLILYTWFVRKSHYSILGRNKVILGVSTMLIQISIGLLKLEAIGFVLANLLGYGLAILLLLRHFSRDMRQAEARFSLRTAKAQFKKHINLPLYTVPAGLINTLCSQLPELLINKLFGSYMLGQYSLANRMINMPLSFLASSVQDIFRQQASAEHSKTGSCRRTYRSFLLLMFMAALLLLVPVVLLVPALFPILFGQQWGESGHLIQAMVFLLAVRFISSPLSYVWIIKGKQQMDLLWQIGLLFVGATAFMLSHFVFHSESLVSTLYLYSALTGLWYVLCIFISYKYAS